MFAHNGPLSTWVDIPLKIQSFPVTPLYFWSIWNILVFRQKHRYCLTLWVHYTPGCTTVTVLPWYWRKLQNVMILCFLSGLMNVNLWWTSAMCITSVCSGLTEVWTPQRSAILDANCSNRVLMVLNYLNCLHESMCHSHCFTAAAPTADGVGEQAKWLTKLKHWYAPVPFASHNVIASCF